MTDPLGFISHTQAFGGTPPGHSLPERPGAERPSFKQALLEQLSQVNDMQQKADDAIEAFATGERDDLEGVILATQKADTAFRTLLAVRNKVMDAYQEVQQIRV